VLGSFVKEIQESLLAGEVDLALHCLKDLPTRPIEGLRLAAHLKREETSDALITRGPAWSEIPQGAIVGTGSVRRTSQLAAVRPDLTFKPLVGNVDTRMRKLQDGAYDAIVLATAGLKRLGVLDNWEASEYAALHVEPLDILPAAGQAILVLEARSGSPFEERAASLNDFETQMSGTAERAFLGHFGTGCSLPIAAHASVSGGLLTLTGLVASADGQQVLRGVENGVAETAESIGIQLAQRLCNEGTLDLLSTVTP
jgi:hydroxymethylbilane synthase